MLGRLIPREGRFFDLFNEQAAHIVAASREMAELMADFTDFERHAANIDRIEKEGDHTTHRTVDMLRRTFITPLDRDDIHWLSTAMDDILDLLQDCAQSISLYDVRHATPEAKRLAEVCMACGAKVAEGVALLDNMDNAQRILSICTEIDRLESEADHIMRAAIAKLFREEPDVRELIKMRAIYELLEAVTDRCEDVANIIEGIVIENA
jgi:predicted phosphate transport protein (TIGR00153 family)